MKTKIILMMAALGFASSSFASDVTVSTLPFGFQGESEGSVVVNLDTSSTEANRIIRKSFYGADTHGFSLLPVASVVTPLELGYVKFGGNLHSTFNWELNAYYDSHDNGIYYTYSPLERRLRIAKQSYKATPLFQINMLGFQPEKDGQGNLVMAETATAKHAGDAITFINGEKKLGLENILMGNEPFNAFEVHGKAIPSADQYIEKYIKYALAVRSAQEKVSGNSNDIKLWGPEIATGWTGWQTTHPDDCIQDNTLPEKMKCSYGNGKFTEFMPYFLYRLAQFEKDSVNNPKKYKMLDFITLHYYPLFRTNFQDRDSIILNNDGTQNVKGMLESVNLWDNENYINKYDYASPRGIAPKIVKKFQDWRGQFYPNAKIAVTEFGVDSMVNIDYDPIVRPLYLADLMARLANAGVDTFVHSFLQSGEESNYWALINGTDKTALYNVYNLYSNFFKGRVLGSTDSFGDKVNVYSVKTESGTNVFLVNKDKNVHTSTLNFKRGDSLDDITNVSLAGYSLTVLSVPDNHNQSIVVRQFGAKEMGINID